MRPRALLFTPVLLFTLLLLTLSSSAAELPTASPEDVGMSAEKLARIDDAIQSLVDNGKFAGNVIVVARRGKIVYAKPFGMMDIGAEKPMKMDTIFRIYSMSKPITTVAAMILVEEGKLKLDDPVATYLPEFANLKVYVKDAEPVDPDRPMTVRDLMRHTSGLTYGHSGNTTIDRQYRDAKVLDRDADLATMTKKLGKIPLLYQPGEKWHYSVSVDVLGRVVEVAGGMPLDEFFQKRIFQPLDMKDTGFFVPEEKQDRFAANYGPGPGGLKVIDDSKNSLYLTNPKMFSGGGGLTSTARDYTRFCQMILGGGQLDGTRLLREETVKNMTQNQLPDDVMPIALGEQRDGFGFGLGFSVVVERSEWDPPAVVGESGWGGAASTHFWISHKHDLLVVALQQHMPYRRTVENTVKPLVYDAVVE